MMIVAIVGMTIALIITAILLVNSELNCYLRRKMDNEGLTLKRHLRENSAVPVLVSFLVFFAISSIIMIGLMKVSDMVYGIVECAAILVALLTYFVLDLTKDSKELDM